MESLDTDELLSLSLTFERCEWDDDGGVSKSGSMVGEGVGLSKSESMGFVGGWVSCGLSSVVGRCVGLCGRGGVLSDIVSPGVTDGVVGEVCAGIVGGS